MVGALLCPPDVCDAQRRVPTGFTSTRGHLVALSSARASSVHEPDRATSSAASLNSPSVDVTPGAIASPALQQRDRWDVAVQGLAVGAVVGAVVGYYFGRHEEYGGVIMGPVSGAAMGAPIGMILVLLTTP